MEDEDVVNEEIDEVRDEMYRRMQDEEMREEMRAEENAERERAEENAEIIREIQAEEELG